MATGATFAVINGQLVQQGLDPAASLKEPVGTCQNCGQTNVVLSTHMGHALHVRYVCTASSSTFRFADPNQSTGVTTKTPGTAGFKHW